MIVPDASQALQADEIFTEAARHFDVTAVSSGK